MDFKEWFDKTIMQPVLDVLNQLAAELKDDQGKVSWRNAIETFTKFCDGSLDSENQKIVDDIINGLGLESQYETLKSVWLKIPRQLRDTAKVLQETPNAISWSIIAEDGKSIGTGDLAGPVGSVVSFTGGGGDNKVDLVLSLQALDSASAQERIAVTCSDDQRILAMSLDGTLALSAGGSLKTGFLSVGGSVDTRGTAAGLDYYYLDKGKWLFAEALFHNVPHLVSPFDAKAIAAARTNNLQAVSVNVTGALNASLDVGIQAVYGSNFVVSGKTLGLDTGDTEVSLGAHAKVGFSSTLNLKGAWTLQAKPKDNRFLTLAVVNDQFKQTNNKITLEAGAGLEGLDAVGKALIDKYLPSAQDLISELREFENPGRLLKNELNKQLGQLLDTGSDTTLQDNLTNVLVGDESAADLAAALGSAAESALNGHVNALGEKAEEAGNKILNDMAAKLDLPQALSDKLVNTASSKMSELLDDLKGKLAEQISKIVDANKDKVAVIFQPLEAVGQPVGGLLKDVDDLAKKLLDPVINFLNQYQALRQKILNVVANSANYSVSLNLSRALNTQKQSVSVLEFEIDTQEANALERYKEMLVGKFSKALADARKTPNGSGGITLTGGSFKKMLSKKLTTDVNFKILGAEISASTILSSDVALQVDAATGEILMAASKGVMEKNLKAFGEEQSVTFVNMMGIPGSIAKGEAGGYESETTKLINGTGLVLAYSDKSLKRSELEAYLGSAQKANLVTKGSLDAALNRYDELAQESKKMQADITLCLPLTSEDIAKLIANKNEDIERIAIDRQVAICLNNPKKHGEFKAVLARWYDRTGTETQQIKKIAACGKLGDALARYDISNIDERRAMNTVDIEDRHYIDIAHQIGTNAVNLAAIVQFVREAADMTITEENLVETRDKLTTFNQDTNKYLKSWLKISGVLSNIGLKKETIPAVTRAFAVTIGQLCQLGEGGKFFLTPSISWSADGSSPIETF